MFAGVSLVQLQSTASGKKAKEGGDNQDPIVGRIFSNLIIRRFFFLGFMAACIGCAISGFAGVFFEKILKGAAPVSIWMRNVQMAMFSIPSSLAASLFQVIFFN